MADLVGKTLGKYQVTERLGRGGMAEVYRGRHPRLGRDVAIKVLHAHLAEGSGFLARFEREAKAVAALHHPNIVQVYDFDVEDGAFYMVMEYVGGGTLKARLDELAARHDHLPMPDVLRILGELAQALDYAHAHGVLHRDVKPSNVLLDPSGRAVLTDFGIAHLVGGAHYTTTGTLMGTPAYMSPEQCRGAEITPASDIYALGVILYELVTGRVPFSADTPLGIAHKQIHEPLPAPRSFRPDLPAVLETVIGKTLAKKPAERYQTAAALARAVAGALAAVTETQAFSAAEEPAGEGPTPEATAAATVVEPEAPQADSAAQPTMMMPDEPAAEEPAPEAAGAPETAGPEPHPPEPAPTPAPPNPPEPAPTPAQPKPPAAAPSPSRLWRRLLVLGLAALALVAALAVMSLRGGGTAPCGSTAECDERANQALARQDPAAAAPLVERALRFVPPSEHTKYAPLWCKLGDIRRSMDQREPAAAAFEQCIEWTQGDPGHGDLRALAEQALRELRGP